MSIYRKLHTLQTKIKGLGKDKSSHNFQYVTGNKLLSHIRPLMDELGLLLKHEVLSVENTRIDYKTKYAEKSEILSAVSMRFTWVDVDTGETDVNLWSANGQNDWEKGLGSALTYGERYFLMKYFHIATDEDDIDNPERKPEPKQPNPRSLAPAVKAAQAKAKASKPTGKPVFDEPQMTKDQEKNINTLCRAAKLTPTRTNAGVKKVTGGRTENAQELTKAEAATLIGMITNIIESDKNQTKA